MSSMTRYCCALPFNLNSNLTSSPGLRHGDSKNHFLDLSASSQLPSDLCLSGLTFAPQTFTASPAARIFCAALISRSWCAAQCGQSHSRIFNGSFSTMYPQLPHRLELGNHRSILTSVRPYPSHLYSSCLTNSPQLASLIERASFRFFIIFFTAKSSTAIVWFSRTNRVVNL